MFSESHRVDTLDLIFDHLMAAISDDAILGFVAALDTTFDVALQAHVLGTLLDAMADPEWREGVGQLLDQLLTQERVTLYAEVADEVSGYTGTLGFQGLGWWTAVGAWQQKDLLGAGCGLRYGMSWHAAKLLELIWSA